MRFLKNFCILFAVCLFLFSIPVYAAEDEMDKGTSQQYTLEEKSDSEILSDGIFSLLLWGNSFSLDAGDSTMCHLMNVLSAMLGPDVEVRIGYLISGNKTYTWHATQIDRGTKPYTFQVDYSNSSQWDTLRDVSADEALTYTDWDVILLQPYSMEARTGVSVPDSVPEDDDPRFFPMNVSAPYLLDYLAQYVPRARVYYYLIWAATQELEKNAGLGDYQALCSFSETALEYSGTQSGKGFYGLVPIGTAVQNARTTYLAKLNYNSHIIPIEASKFTDPQIGLQRDNVHISFYLGRYIVLSTLAETVVPQSIRVSGYVLPAIHETIILGALPQEYTTIARLAVEAAVEGWQKNGQLSVTEISGFETDPIYGAEEVLKDISPEIPCAVDEEALTRQIKERILAELGKDFAVDSVEYSELYTDQKQPQTLPVSVKVRFGYSSCSVPILCSVGTHSYQSETTEPTCLGDGHTTYTCACGHSFVTDEVPAVGHTWGQWEETSKPDATNDGINTRICTVCGETETEVVDNNIFTDVKKDRFEDAILWAYYGGITTGTGDGTMFSPEKACTRKQIVTFLWRAAGEPDPKSMENPFTDVKQDRFEKAILWAYYEGITTGTGDGSTFSPENTCTRKQIVTFLWRYNGEPAPKSMENKFMDVKNDRFAPAILWAAEQGITTGTGDGSTFSPENPCTRKQIVTFLYRNLAA